MKIADLYIRVNTDEQAEKGYSQRNQEERLRKYCGANSIQIRKVILEDHSAKTFNRPEWCRLLVELRLHKGQSDLILFTKWDRFSRNAGDAYQMISTLRKLGIEPEGVEQPLDLSIPENKMMLAFYLAAPEVENDRRALNVFNGMRRGKKEGRYMGTAPLGYINKMSETGKKYIALRESESNILKWAFQELASSGLNTEQVWKLAKEKGLTRGSKNNFWIALRNPLYCGKIFIPKYQDEESCLVQGQHEPLISEALFYEVQDILKGRKKILRTTQSVDEAILLRGYLICPKCGRLLTGSASKGCRQYYHYYHCNSSCGIRFNATKVNKAVVDEIRKYVIPVPNLQLFKEVILSVLKAKTSSQRNDIQQLKSQLFEANQRLSRARNLLLAGDIESDDYRLIKSETEEKINRWEAQLAASVTDTTNTKPLWDKAISNISQLDILYAEGTVIQKRKIISSMFPEKLTFDGFQHRTIRVNDAIGLMCLINSKLQGKKNGTNPDISDLSREVTPQRLELWTHRLRVCCSTN